MTLDKDQWQELAEIFDDHAKQIQRANERIDQLQAHGRASIVLFRQMLIILRDGANIPQSALEFAMQRTIESGVRAGVPDDTVRLFMEVARAFELEADPNADNKTPAH